MKIVGQKAGDGEQTRSVPGEQSIYLEPWNEKPLADFFELYLVLGTIEPSYVVGYQIASVF